MVEPFSSLGGLLTGVGLVGAGLGLREAIDRVHEHTARKVALSEKIGWLTPVAPGVVMQKDGSLMCAWTFEGLNFVGVPAAEANVHGRHLNRAILPFSDSCVFHFDAVRRRASGHPATVPGAGATCRLIDLERARIYSRGRRFETRTVLTFTWLPPRSEEQRFERYLVKNARVAVEGWARHLGRFLETARIVEERLSHRLAMHRMSTPGLLSHLYFCISGKELPILPPPEGVRLDTLLAPGVYRGGRRPMIGDRPLRVVSWDGFPPEGQVGFLDRLMHLPFEYRWSTRVRVLGRAAGEKAIRRQQMGFFESRTPASQLLRKAMASGPVSAQEAEDDKLFQDSFAQLMAVSGQEAAAENQSGGIRVVHYDGAVVVHDTSEARAEERARQIVKELAELGCNAFMEEWGINGAFFGTLPGNGSDNLRQPLLTTRNAVDLGPFTSAWVGEPEVRNDIMAGRALMRTDGPGGTALWFNPWVGDVAHTLVFGATGAGKSTLIGQLAASFRARYPGAQVFGFDKGASSLLLTEAVGGTFHVLKPEDPGCGFQPFAHLDRPGEQAWAAEWLETVADLQGVRVTTRHREAIREALESLAGRRQRMRTFTQFMGQLQDESGELVKAFSVYTARGPYGAMFDAEEEVLPQGAWEVTDLHHVMRLGKKLAVPTLLYRFHRLEERFDPRIPTFLWVDEAWLALTHSKFGPMIGEWAVTLRKYNVWLLLALQSVSQMLEVAGLIRNALLESCKTRIFLPNPRARETHVAEAYRAVGLDDAQIDVIAEARQKREYLFDNDLGRQLFDLNLTPAAKAFLFPRRGLDVEATRTHIASLKEIHGDRWPAAWLREAGLEDAAGEFHALQEEEVMDEVAFA
jgi:type IV secretion/conjugal transfer VirB4 family ATPase